jgi:GMP synthase (glutamine-hydrolysing)
VNHNPKGQEIGTTEVTLLEAASLDPLLGGMPTTIDVHVCHSQSVLRLPPGAVRLAANRWDGNQAFRAGDCAWGVQFHPEFDAGIMSAYAAAEGLPSRITVNETPFGSEILRRFAALVFQSEAREGR